MGNNAAFSSFEASVIAVYDKGVLDRELLDALAAPYADTDIDRGGMEGTLTKDGLDIDDVVLKIYGVTIPPRPLLPPDWKDWTAKQEAANDKWNDRRYEKISKITRGWGWC